MEKQKIVLITGCSSGIGLQTAVYLAKKGYKVYASMRNLKKKEKLISEANKVNVSVKIAQLDVTDEQSIENTVNNIINQEQRIDVLVNNAGFGSGGFLEDYTINEVKEQFETNFFGLIKVTQAVLPIMRKQQNGIIVNVSSIGGKKAFPALSIYNASKFAVEALTESLRVELAPFGIKVTAIEPTNINTNFSSSVHAAKKSGDQSSPYYEYFKRFEKNILKMGAQGDNPIIVAKTIYRAIQSKNPRRSYPTGKGATMMILLTSMSPNYIFEKVIRKMLLG